MNGGSSSVIYFVHLRVLHRCNTFWGQEPDGIWRCAINIDDTAVVQNWVTTIRGRGSLSRGLISQCGTCANTTLPTLASCTLSGLLVFFATDD